MKKQNTILIVDDVEMNRVILQSLFAEEYNLLEAENGAQAMMLLRQYSGQIATVLLDLIMPEKDGYQVLEEMGKDEALSRIPVIVITSDDTRDSKVRVFQMGASDIITKPFEPDVVKSRVKNIVELNRHRRHLEELVEEQSASLRESNSIIIDMLSSVIEYRSLESGQHIQRIRYFTQILLEDVAKSYQEYDLDPHKIQIITDASSMHDIGKIAIPDSILNKPGRLTPQEFEVMKTHTTKGCEILSGLERLQDQEYVRYAYNICRYHHERWDGAGYPDGLRGDSIPICAQVVAVADCYDALTTDRVYKKAIPPQEAFNMILNGECGVFSPKLLECFKNVKEQFAALSRQYGDGVTGGREGLRQFSVPKCHQEDSDNTLEQGQMKYFAMLRFAGATVMEVDLNTRIYHLVYLADRNFEILRSGNPFEEAVGAFVQEAVYPEDRPVALELVGPYLEEFFAQGWMKCVRRYRVLRQENGQYEWCRTTLLRIDTENPRQRKLMLIWEWENKLESKQNTQNTGQLLMERMLGGIQKFRYDQYFTMVEVNQGFLDLVGYTQEEIQKKFQNRYMELICSADRERMARQTREQLHAGVSAELEYRIMTKTGESVWVLDRRLLVSESDGKEYLYCILIDITQAKQAEEDLRLSLERHKLIMDQTNDIIFEWDIEKDELIFSSNWEKEYGYTPITKQASLLLSKASHVHPEDLPALMQSRKDILSGVAYKEIEIRLAGRDGQYRWSRCRLTAQFDEQGKPLKAVGVLIDIDDQKRQAQELKDRAERDLLTKLYNKTSSRARIESYLKSRGPGELAALMVIDIDDFKQVNDRYGHMFGDAVLAELASAITRLFRVQDIVARIGGDEFTVFMTDLPNQEIAKRRAGQMIETFREMLRENMQELTLSCSIGLAFSQDADDTYQKLFEQADRALYQAKAAGKNRYLVYEKAVMDFPFGMNPASPANNRTQIDSDGMAEVGLSNLINLTFQRLYETEDFDQAVHSILEMVGKLFNVSRVYIFENIPDDEHCSNTFEWCNESIVPEKELLQNIRYRDLGGDYRDHFQEGGIFYCPDVKKLPAELQKILEPQGILAMLQCAIQDGGAFKGYVGFDDCVIHRLWTQEQISALIFVAKLLSTFLLKKRAQDQVIESRENLRGILDHQGSWIYVIDPVNYQLRYINEKTRQLAPEAREGIPCYQAFFNRQKPCARCPVEKLKTAEHCVMEVYNPIFHVWSMADASRVRWGKEKAYLLACHDITRYKGGTGQLGNNR